MRPRKGFRETGESGPKQPGSQEQDANITKEQRAKKLIQGAWSIGCAKKNGV